MRCEKVPPGTRLHFQKSFFFLTASLFFPTDECVSLASDAATHLPE